MDVICAGRTIVHHGHLAFILTDEDAAGYVFAVQLRTKRAHSDTTVVLGVGDHPFIRHESVVDFSTLAQFRVSRIRSALSSGRSHLEADMSGLLAMRIREGLMQSPRTVNAFRDQCKALWGKEKKPDQ